MRNYIQLETSGVIVTEDFSTNSNQSRILLNDGEEIVLEDGVNSPKQSHVELELSEIDGDIILDGTDSSGSNAGDFLVHEAFHDYRESARLLSEFHNVFASEGHIPLANFRLNSSSKVTVGHVQAAEIIVRSTGEIALEDATDTTNTNTKLCESYFKSIMFGYNHIFIQKIIDNIGRLTNISLPLLHKWNEDVCCIPC